MAGRNSAAGRLMAAGLVFSALGDPTRLKIVARLCGDGPSSIARLCAVADVSRQAITKHLNTLEATGLVGSRRVGRERIWELKAGKLADVRRYLDQVSREWDRSIERLRVRVER
jgi:DNA-binding transcriptional ArsR family regulator